MMLESLSHSVKVHPVTLFSILDHHIRRGEENERVIGALLGSFNDNDKEWEVRNCFPIPYSETQEVAIDIEFFKNMFDLHKKANSKEKVIGWYSTTEDVNENSALVHEFFWGEVGLESSPLHLTVDCTLSRGNFGVTAYISSELRESGSVQFYPVKLQLDSPEAENVGVEALMKMKEEGDTTGHLLTELQDLHLSLHKLLEMIEVVSNYVDQVVAKKIPGDNGVGRFLAQALARLPTIDASAFEKMFNSHIQDLLMVVYLANLTRTQLILGEKLQNMVGVTI